MATDTHTTLAINTFNDPAFATEFDRILHTADDRPDSVSLPALANPAADHADPALAARRADVEEKHRRVRALLATSGHDAALLGRADSIAWFTVGADLGQDLSDETAHAVLLVNQQCRVVITDNVQSARIFEEELAGLGFQLKERSWLNDPSRLVEELARGKRILSDLARPANPWKHDLDPLGLLRIPLTSLERRRLRELGRSLSLAVEATCRNFDPGETEADVAGHLAHRLMREGIAPLDIRVAADDRAARFRRAPSRSAPIRSHAVVTATGRRHGLCASLSRIVSFGPPSDQLKSDHALAAMAEATCIFFSRPGQSISDAFRRTRRIYEKYAKPDEWQLDYQGHAVGYSPREFILMPDSPFQLQAHMALSWSPGVGAARSQSTVILDSRGYEDVTAPVQWPMLEVAVKGIAVHRPGILVRDPSRTLR